MNVEEQINQYIASLSDQKQKEIERLHHRMLKLFPNCKLWFLDGKDDKGKIVTNPNIGYGTQTIKYADGKTKEFYQIGISGNAAGISVYIIGIDDKKYLSGTYGETIGKANVTGYCIKFKSLADIQINILEEMMKDGFRRTSDAIKK